MPDIANALKFQKKMIAAERSYLKQINEYRADARRTLLDILARDGVSRTAVRQMVNTITDLSRNVQTAAAATSRDVRRHVVNYTRKNVELAKRAGLTDSADIAPILNAGSRIAQDGELSYMTNTSAWVSQLETSIQTQSARLRISNASRDEQIDRLLSENLADGRASVWLANSNRATGEEVDNMWLYGIGLLGAYLSTFNEQQEATYQKQAIATIDERTTDCCLRVHGQVQPLNEPFHLTGTPRYADEVQNPPFHWYCRTSEALYHESFEEFGIPTSKMQDAAEAELQARERTKTRVKIYPSHATARR